MKKLFYGILLTAVACMTTTVLASCDENDESENVEINDRYLCMKYWVSNDLLDIADVTSTGLGTLTFTNAATYKGVNGKESNLVELSGKDAIDAAFTIKLTLKPNWKEILAQKETIECCRSYGMGTTKGQGVLNLGLNFKGGTFSRSRLGAEFEEEVAAYIETLNFDFNAHAI